MAARKLSEKDLQEVRKLAKQWGKIVVGRAFGENGPGLDVDLDAMEQVAVAAAQGLTEGTLEQATLQQAAGMAGEQLCPQCGQLCPVVPEGETRPITVRGGSFEHCEPKCYCDRCRRSFFPAAVGAQTGHPCL